MKLVTATVPEYVLDELRDTLLSIGIKGMTISAAKCRSLDDAHEEFDHQRLHVFQNSLEIMLETVVHAALVTQVVDAITATCNEAAAGNAPILVSDVMLGIRIRNAEIVTEG